MQPTLNITSDQRSGNPKPAKLVIDKAAIIPSPLLSALSASPSRTYFEFFNRTKPHERRRTVDSDDGLLTVSVGNSSLLSKLCSALSPKSPEKLNQGNNTSSNHTQARSLVRPLETFRRSCSDDKISRRRLSPIKSLAKYPLELTKPVTPEESPCTHPDSSKPSLGLILDSSMRDSFHRDSLMPLFSMGTPPDSASHRDGKLPDSSRGPSPLDDVCMFEIEAVTSDVSASICPSLENSIQLQEPTPSCSISSSSDIPSISIEPEISAITATPSQSISSFFDWAMPPPPSTSQESSISLIPTPKPDLRGRAHSWDSFPTGDSKSSSNLFNEDSKENTFSGLNASFFSSTTSITAPVVIAPTVATPTVPVEQSAPTESAFFYTPKVPGSGSPKKAKSACQLTIEIEEDPVVEYVQAEAKQPSRNCSPVPNKGCLKVIPAVDTRRRSRSAPLRVHFSSTAELGNTHLPTEYERANSPKRLSAFALAVIGKELNVFKTTEMTVHPESAQNTQLFLS